MTTQHTPESELLTALTNLMAVINPDDDGGWFICEEAGSVIESARQAIARAANQNKPEEQP